MSHFVFPSIFSTPTLSITSNLQLITFRFYPLMIDIIITAFVAIWVVRSVQSKIDSEKVLKDFFSKELIQLRSDLRLFLDKLIAGGVEAQSIKRGHHLLSVRIQDLLSAMNKKYGIDKRFLKAYQLNLMKVVEADDNYVQSFSTNSMVTLKDETVSGLHALRTNNDHLFNDILLKLYETR